MADLTGKKPLDLFISLLDNFTVRTTVTHLQTYHFYSFLFAEPVITPDNYVGTGDSRSILCTAQRKLYIIIDHSSEAVTGQLTDDQKLYLLEENF